MSQTPGVLWDRRINRGINPYAGKPQRIRRNNQSGAGLPNMPNPGDLLQRAVTDAVVNGKRYAARQAKRAKRLKTRTRRANAKIIMQKKRSIRKQEGGRVRRKPVNHMPVVYQYHQ
ncbi:Hypothetical predicted protein [Paramuricea clavata]|uniref:Uncharacterized protein n=1 Tax=Paramuricea clavata TaxID=317549 RepID=A0A6S7H418_PARCT|nr:Hypothetical predicted protein [Paramuricea clavata]